MNLTKFDLSLIIVMSLAVIVMSFMFPALGLTDESTNSSEIPEYNVGNNTFDIAGEFPQQPNTATSGVLHYDQQQGNSIAGVNLEWLKRPKDTGNSIELQNTSQYGFNVVFINYTSTGSEVSRYPIDNDSEGETILIQDYGWTIEATVDNVTNYNQSNMTAEVEWNIRSDPDSSSGVSAIPIIGGVADAVANVLGFLAVVITWIVFTAVEIIINTVVTIAGLSGYLISLATWLVTTYGAIVGSAPGFAKLVLTVPTIILGLELAKVVAVIISLFPTT